MDQRSFFQVIDNEFTPSDGPPCVISRIFKQKIDEPWPSWKKVWLEVHDMWFEEFKATQLQRPPTAWEVVEKTKKLKSGEWVNDKTRELAVNSIFYLFKHYFKEATSTNDSNSIPINDYDIYLEVVGGKNEKGNVYGLGKLTNKFMCSTRIPTNLIDMSMVQQMEEMCNTIHKLNNEIVEKKAEKLLEEKWCNCYIIMRSKVSRFDNKMKK
ncbi:hypothetical protein CR513_31774, partial [Mucuna pruriens]